MTDLPKSGCEEAAKAMKNELDRHHEWDSDDGKLRGCGHTRLQDADFLRMAVVAAPILQREVPWLREEVSHLSSLMNRVCDVMDKEDEEEAVVALERGDLCRSAPETPEAVREQALIAIGRFLPPILQREAANIIDAIAPILRSADQQEIARLSEILRGLTNENARLLQHISVFEAAHTDEVARLTQERDNTVKNAKEIVNAVTAELNDEQVAHNRIAELCHKAGVSTPDGTSVGAVERLAAALATAREHIEEINGLYDANCARLTARLAEVEGALGIMQYAMEDIYDGLRPSDDPVSDAVSAHSMSIEALNTTIHITSTLPDGWRERARETIRVARGEAP